MTLGHVVLTGGMGFIGYNLALLMREKQVYTRLTIIDLGHEPYRADGRELLRDDNVTHVRGSVMDPETYDQICGPVDCIVHAAGFLGVNAVAVQSIATLDNNIDGTRRCLEFAANQPNLSRFLSFSTSEVYGSQANSLDETQPMIAPSTGKRWCYAVSKMAAEHYTKAFSREYGFNYSIVRPFNVFGPFRSGTNAMSAFIDAALAGDPIHITGDGSQRRAWCYIDDFVGALLSLLQRDTAVNETFNIGNPENYCSIRELAELVIRLTGSSSLIINTGQHIEDVMDRRPLVTKANKLLGFSPSEDLEASVGKTIDWVRQTSAKVGGSNAA